MAASGQLLKGFQRFSLAYCALGYDRSSVRRRDHWLAKERGMDRKRS